MEKYDATKKGCQECKAASKCKELTEKVEKGEVKEEDVHQSSIDELKQLLGLVTALKNHSGSIARQELVSDVLDNCVKLFIVSKQGKVKDLDNFIMNIVRMLQTELRLTIDCEIVQSEGHLALKVGRVKSLDDKEPENGEPEEL